MSMNTEGLLPRARKYFTVQDVPLDRTEALIIVLSVIALIIVAVLLIRHFRNRSQGGGGYYARTSAISYPSSRRRKVREPRNEKTRILLGAARASVRSDLRMIDAINEMGKTAISFRRKE